MRVTHTQLLNVMLTSFFCGLYLEKAQIFEFAHVTYRMYRKAALTYVP